LLPVRRAGFLVVGALAQLAPWLVLRPVTADSLGEGAVVGWLVTETVLAVLIGAAARDGLLAVRTVLAGWVLQTAEYRVTVDKGDEHNLWGVLLPFLAGLAVVLAGVAWLTARSTRRTGARRGE
jgi:hypothetical protein